MNAYLAAKPRDIHFPSAESITNTPPFVTENVQDEAMVDAACPSIDWADKCPVFETVGDCKSGMKCRFLGGHVKKTEDNSLELIVDEEKKAMTAVTETEVNFASADVIKQIRTKKVRDLAAAIRDCY